MAFVLITVGNRAKRDIDASVASDAVPEVDNSGKRSEIVYNLGDPYLLQTAAKRLPAPAFLAQLIKDKPWVKADTFWVMTFAEELAKGWLSVAQLNELSLHLEQTICVELSRLTLEWIARSRKDWPSSGIISWFLARVDAKKVVNYHNLLVMALKNPVTVHPSRGVGLALIDAACEGQLHFAHHHDLVQDFCPRMAGRRIFVGDEEVTRSLVPIFAARMEGYENDHVMPTLFQHNLMVGVGTDWVLDSTCTLAFPLIWHNSFLTPLLLGLLNLGNIDVAIARVRTGEDLHLSVGSTARATYRQELIKNLEHRKHEMELANAHAK